MRKRHSLFSLTFLLLALLSMFALIATLPVNAQGSYTPPDMVWSKTYGGTNFEYAYSIIQTSDGGYALAGSTNSSGAGASDGWLVKTDSLGNQLWNKTYGGTNDDCFRCVVQTSDGGYVLTGYTRSSGAGVYDYWLVKTDANGNIIWSNMYGGTNADYAFSVIQTNDGSYTIGGHTYSFGAGNNDFWLVKTDTNGNMVWNKTYGGTKYDYAYSLVQASDGGYLLGGETNSYGNGNYDAYLVKTDASGNLQWDKTIGGIAYDDLQSIVQTNDDGFAFVGYTNSSGAGGYDYWLVKTDVDGNKMWEKTYGGTNSDYGFKITKTIEGGFALTGYSNSVGAGYFDVWLVKTDANGNMLWNKTFGSATNVDVGYVGIQASDGGYALAGYTYSYGAGYTDFWLIKTTAESWIPAPTPTLTPTPSPTPTPTITPTPTPTPIITPSPTPKPTIEPTPTLTPIITPKPTIAPTETPWPSVTAFPLPTETPSPTPTVASTPVELSSTANLGLRLSVIGLAFLVVQQIAKRKK